MRRVMIWILAMTACGAGPGDEPPSVASEDIVFFRPPPGCYATGRPADPASITYDSSASSDPSKLISATESRTTFGTFTMTNLCQWSVNNKPLSKFHSWNWNGNGLECDVIVELTQVTGQPRFAPGTNPRDYNYFVGNQPVYRMVNPYPVHMSNNCLNDNNGYSYLQGDPVHRLGDLILWNVPGSDPGDLIETMFIHDVQTGFVREEQGWFLRQL